ncbi:MAG: hypothetical protein VX549_12205 [Pseudomonadota bacterium]|nr:hypothetical protein [Pseudomonadota bacterium]
MKTGAKSLSELALALLLGAAPMLIVLNLDGAEAMGRLIATFIALDSVLCYYLVLLLMFPIAWLLGHFVNPAYAPAKWCIAFLVYVFQYAGSATLGLYRLAAGLLLVFPFLWVSFERDVSLSLRVSMLFFYELLCVVAACVLSWLHDYPTASISDALATLESTGWKCNQASKP